MMHLLLLVLLSVCSFSVCQDSVYHFINETKSWRDAQTFCREHYTDLATVHNMEDVRKLNETVNDVKGVSDRRDAWIGLNQTSDNLQDRKWHWSQPGLKYSESEAKWNYGEPSDKGTGTGTQENCGAIYSNCNWLDGGCDNKYCFICYNKSSSSVIIINDNNQKRNWLTAQTYCREHNTDLVSGLDQLNKIQRSNSCPDKCWIGLSRDTWGWSDGSDSSFRNWHEDDPVLETKPQENTMKCARLDQDKWRRDNCTDTNPFICYDNHYILVKENKSWEEAFSYCRQNYRDLAWISDKHQQTSVQARAKMADSEFVWLGLYYTCFLEEWVWVNGRYVSNGNWEDNNPNNCSVSGAMERGGDKWVKKRSDDKFNFICARYC